MLGCGVLVMCVLLGCQAADETTGEPPEPPSGSSSDTAAVQLTAEELAAWGMSVADKQSGFEPGFPWQAPVIDGTIAESQVDAAGTHLYRIEVDRPATLVSEWYRRSYPNANWVVHDERTTDDEEGTTTVLEVTKGAGAWSRILIEGDGSGTVVEASVGVGSPPEGVF
jgi:hypothetical protein